MTCPTAPDELDVFRVTGASSTGVPRITLLVDDSSSLNGGPQFSNCPYFANTFNGGDFNFKKIEQVQSAMVGCTNANDGLLDVWAGKMIFSLRGMNEGLLAEFGTDVPPLEAGIMSVNFNSNTPMSEALDGAGRHFDEFFDSANTAGCAQHYIILLADGNAAGGAFGNFNYACNGDSA